MIRSRALPFLIAIFLPAIAGAADATFSLPLQGHYHPGRFTPIHIAAQTDSRNDPLILKATGAVTLEIQPTDGKIDAVIPWLSIRSISDITWSTAGGSHAVELPLHALDSDERLIGFAGADPDALAGVFTGQKLIRLPLDPADPLPGDISAWESLDGVVLDKASAGKLTQGKLRALLAGGTAVAFRTSAKPGDNWPWRQQGAYWICRIDLAGPNSAYPPNPQEAYGPTQTWFRGWPVSLRRSVILAAIVFMLLTTALTLWRSRWMVISVLILCGIATALTFVWRNRQSPVIETSGSIITLTGSTTQHDLWQYRAALREADDAFPLSSATRPVFAYRRQADDLNVVQQCAADGVPMALHYHLKPGQSMAFQTRFLNDTREKLTMLPAANSPFRAMADRIYTMKDDRIVGQADETGSESWPAVIIERR